jgi:hypothetical protein
MYRVQAHVGKNRLYVVFGGEMSVEEFRAATAEIAQAVVRLKAPFDMVADISELKPLPEGTEPVIRETAELLRAKGIRRVVRVVGRAAHAAVQFERATRMQGYAANLAFTKDEAEQVLDGFLI